MVTVDLYKYHQKLNHKFRGIISTVIEKMTIGSPVKLIAFSDKSKTVHCAKALRDCTTTFAKSHGDAINIPCWYNEHLCWQSSLCKMVDFINQIVCSVELRKKLKYRSSHSVFK